MTSHEITDGSVEINWSLSAPPAEVWPTLSRPALLGKWLGTVTSGAVEEDSELIVDHGDGYLCTSRIATAEPGRELAMSWQFPDEHATTLRITLTPGDDGTDCSLRLRHDDLRDLAESYLPGWTTHLTFLEATVDGETLPRSAFWRLYETFAALANR